MGTGAHGYGIEVRQTEDGWRVVILDPAGTVVRERMCGDAAEARTFASTVRQHLYWLTTEKFREYYQV